MHLVPGNGNILADLAQDCAVGRTVGREIAVSEQYLHLPSPKLVGAQRSAADRSRGSGFTCSPKGLPNTATAVISITFKSLTKVALAIYARSTAILAGKSSLT